jgi:hypothetical protein
MFKNVYNTRVFLKKEAAVSLSLTFLDIVCVWLFNNDLTISRHETCAFVYLSISSVEETKFSVVFEVSRCMYFKTQYRLFKLNIIILIVIRTLAVR